MAVSPQLVSELATAAQKLREKRRPIGVRAGRAPFDIIIPSWIGAVGAHSVQKTSAFTTASQKFCDLLRADAEKHNDGLASTSLFS